MTPEEIRNDPVVIAAVKARVEKGFAEGYPRAGSIEDRMERAMDYEIRVRRRITS